MGRRGPRAERILGLDDDGGTTGRRILGFLRNEVGRAQLDVNPAAAAKAFRAAIDTDAQTAPAYLNLGDIFERQGDIAAAVHEWEKLTDAQPERAHLAFDRLQQAYGRLSTPGRFVDLASA